MQSNGLPATEGNGYLQHGVYFGQNLCAEVEFPSLPVKSPTDREVGVFQDSLT